MSRKEKATREYLETLSKEQVINLCLQFMFDVEVTEQQLAVKGQEINIKNNKLAELKKELTICKDKLRRKTQSNRDLQHRVHNVNTQLAIQELEKVKELAVRLLDGFCHSINYSKKEFRGHRYVDFYDLIRGIDNQITELGGFEKWVK